MGKGFNPKAYLIVLLSSIFIAIGFFAVTGYASANGHGNNGKDNNPPKVPQNLQVTAKTSNSVTLSWKASKDNKKVVIYEIYQGEAKAGETHKTSYTVEGLRDYTDYSFTVKARDLAWNESKASNAVTVKTDDATPPTAPGNLSATKSTRDSISLAWEASTDNAGVTGYLVYMGESLIDETIETSYVINGLTDGTSYCFSVKAKDAAGNISEPSSLDVAAPRINVSPIAADGRTVEKSPMITAVIDSSYRVKSVLFLAKALAAPDSVYYPYAPKTKAPYSWAWPTGDPWVPDDEYILKMQITYEDGSVEEVTRVLLAHNHKDSIPAAPANVRFTEVTDNSVTLVWDASVDKDVVEYEVYQDGQQVGTTKETTYKFGNLTKGNTYKFRILAKDMDGNISVHDNTAGVKVEQGLAALPAISAIKGEGNIGIAGNDGTYSGTVKLSVDVSSTAGVDRVEFYSKALDAEESAYWKFPASGIKASGSTYSVNWSTDPQYVPDGKYIIKAVVYDVSGQSSTVTGIFVTDNVEEAPAERPWKPADNPPEKMIIAYLAGWSPSYDLLYDADASRLTHINYAFASIANTEYTIQVEDTDVKNFVKLNLLKQKYPHLKTIISVGGWGGSANFSPMAATDEARTKFADSVVDFLLKYNFDGVDLDWEYPVSGGGTGTTPNPNDKQTFPLLLQKLREKLDAQGAKDGKHYSLSIAAGANSSFANNTTIGDSQRYLDYVQLMTYDIHGTWEALADYNAPLYDDGGATYSVDRAVNIFLNAGVPKEKLIMGVPFYGYQYTVNSTDNNGLRQGIVSGAAISYKSIVSGDLEKNGYTRYWSDGSKVPYLWNPTTKTFISYDDPESIKLKAEYISDNDLGGAMIWQLAQDHNIGLLDALYQPLKGEAVVPADKPPILDSIDVTPIAPDGKTVSGTPQITVNPTDDNGISKVEFYTKAAAADDSTYYKLKTATAAPYSAGWATDPWVKDGEYTIKVVVYDTANQTTALTRNVIVNNNVAVPTSLVSTAEVGTNVLLSWTEVAGAAGYEIYEGTNKVGTTTIANNFMVSGLNPDTDYAFTVKAKNTSGVLSAASNSVTIRTESQAPVNSRDLNSYVAQIVSTYEIGKYPYLLNNDYAHYNGVTQDIVYQGATIARANPDGSKSSHCVGLTFEVFFRAMQARNTEAGISPDNFNNMTIADMNDFLLTWYVALGTPKADGDQLAGAIVKYGLGTRITNLEDVKTGDFVDLSRTSSGHTAVFMNWIRDNNNNIIGFKYWSSQGSTNGINYKEEYFNDTGLGTVDRNQLYIGRVGAIDNYQPFAK